MDKFFEVIEQTLKSAFGYELTKKQIHKDSEVAAKVGKALGEAVINVFFPEEEEE